LRSCSVTDTTVPVLLLFPTWQIAIAVQGLLPIVSGLRQMRFPIDLLEMSRLLLLLVAFDVEPTCQPAWLTAIIALRSMLVEQLRDVVVVLTE